MSDDATEQQQEQATLPAEGAPEGQQQNPEGGKPFAEMTAEEKVEFLTQKTRRLEDQVRGRNPDPQKDPRVLRKVIKEKDDEIARLAERAAMLDALEEATKTEAEKERDRYKAEVEKLRAAADEQRRAFGSKLVQTKLDAAAPRKGMEPADLAEVAGDLTRFLADGGEVDEDALDAFLAKLPDVSKREAAPLAPAALGGGRRSEAKASGLAAGAALFEELHRKKAATL